MENYEKTNPDFERDLVAYTAMLAYINIKDPKIEFLGVNGHTVDFKKNGKVFSHALTTWQCAPDPTRPGITEEQVADWVLEAMKDY